MKKDNNSFKSFGSHEEGKISDNSNNSFFCENGLKNVKDEVLRIKCESAFESLAISKREFYDRAKISPQYWWRLSYGYDDFPKWLRFHLFREFGDCFLFLFDYKKEGEKNENK